MNQVKIGNVLKTGFIWKIMNIEKLTTIGDKRNIAKLGKIEEMKIKT